MEMPACGSSRPSEPKSNALQELYHHFRKTFRVIHVDHVTRLQRLQASVGSSQRQLLQVCLSCDSAICPTDQQRGTIGRQPVLPVVAVQVVLRSYRVPRIKRQPPSFLRFPERVLQIGQKAVTDALHQILAGPVKSSPGECEA